MKPSPTQRLLEAARLRRPLVLAHRGGRGLHPENSLLAFRSSAADGAEGAEFDVRLCASGEVVVFHDEKLDRLTDGRGKVARLPWEEVRRARIRSPAGGLSEERIPLLEEALGVFPDGFFLNVEIKFEEGSAYRVTRSVLDVLRRKQAASRFDLVVSSFQPSVLVACRFLEPTVARGYLWERAGKSRVGRFLFERLIAPAALHPEAALAKPKLFAKAAARNQPVVPWTVNDPAEMARLAQEGAAALITDRPDVARKTLNALPAAQAPA